jgi:hypothetical protein
LARKYARKTGVDGRIILKWTLQKTEAFDNSSGFGWGPVADSCEHGSETSTSIKGGEFHCRLALLGVSIAPWVN